MAEPFAEPRADTPPLRFRSRLAPPRVRAPSLSRTQRAVLAFATAAAAIFAVQAPVLGHYFFNDDFVPLADITTRTAPGYIKDLFLLRDLTPNWRFLTGLYYLGAYRAFGLSAMPYFLVSILVHIGTAGLIFWLVRRALDSDWAAWFAAAFFGLSAAPVPTLGQVTAFNNVLAAFFVMLAIVLLYEGLERRARFGWWLAAPAVAFAAAIAANESAMAIAPVLGLVVLWKLPQPDGWWRKPRSWAMLAIASAPFALLGTAALAGFGACHCTEANQDGVSTFGSHMAGNYWIFLSRLLYPIGLAVPGRASNDQLLGGLAVAGLAIALLVRGPTLARVCSAFLFLALLPNTTIQFALAERYTYLASAPFAILAAVLFFDAARLAGKVTPVLPAALAAIALGVLGVHGWQTWVQNHQQADASDKWRSLVEALRDEYPQVPLETVVYVRGGPLTDPLAQCAVMPALAHALWGSDRLVFAIPAGELQSYLVRPGYNVYVGDYVDGRIVPAPTPVATSADLQRTDVELLPHTSPDATGNLCRPAP